MSQVNEQAVEPEDWKKPRRVGQLRRRPVKSNMEKAGQGIPVWPAFSAHWKLLSLPRPQRLSHV